MTNGHGSGSAKASRSVPNLLLKRQRAYEIRAFISAAVYIVLGEKGRVAIELISVGYIRCIATTRDVVPEFRCTVNNSPPTLLVDSFVEPGKFRLTTSLTLVEDEIYDLIVKTSSVHVMINSLRL